MNKDPELHALAYMEGHAFDLLLTRYAIERLLHRLSLSAPFVRETVITEKFQAMVMLGLANSRMKDFYDVWILSRSYDFDEDRLSRAIAAPFERRGTALPFDEHENVQRVF